jgi:chromosome segregation protein
MRVTRLEIFGFKSFLEKLTLPLEAGFTGVVGPNGCGKSNIVDAIRWVLGETRASQLRGGTLEDVIFNGTDKLRPLGLAEVTLTLRSANQDFFSEIVGILTRQGNQFAAVLAEEPGREPQDSVSELDGGAREAPEGAAFQDEIDSEAVPRLTVIDGRKDSGRSSDSASPGQQGLTVLDGGANIEADPQEMMNLVAEVSPTEGEIAALSVGPEEAAGQPGQEDEAAQLESGQTDAGQLEDACDEEYARKAVARFGWLRNVQEVQVTRRLYRSGESEFFINRVPCRLKDIKELFRLCGIGARAYTIVAQGEVGRIVTSRPEERRLIIEEAAGVAGFREKISAASRRLEETNQNLLRLEDIAKEVQRQVNSLRVQASRAKARQELKDRIVAVEERLFAGELCALERSQGTRAAELEERRKQEQSAQAALDRCSAEEQEARGSSLAADLEGDDIRRRIDAITDELRRRSEVRAQCVARITEMTSKLAAAREQRDGQNERRATLVERKSEAERTISDLERQEAELVNELGQLGGGFDELLRATSEELRARRAKLAEQEQQFRNSRDALVSAKSRLETLQDQVEAHSPIAHMKDLLVEQSKRANPDTGASGSPGDEGLKELIASLSADARVLVSALTVPEELERAVHAALGSRVAALVVPDVSRVAVQCGELVASSSVDNRTSNGSRPLKEMAGQFPSITALSKDQEAPGAPGAVAQNIPQELDVDGVRCPALITLLHVQTEQQELLERLLRGVYLAPSAKVAARYFERSETRLDGGNEAPSNVSQVGGGVGSAASYEAQFVTPQGELLRAGEYHYAGKVNFGALRLQREAHQLSEEIKAFEACYEGAALVRSEIQAQIGEAERRHGEALAEARRHQVRARELANQQGAIRGRLQSERRVLAQIEQDIVRAENAMNQFERDGETYAQQLAVREEELQRLDAAPDAAGESRDLNGELEELRGQWKEIEERRSAQRDVLGKLAQRLQMARNELERARANVSRAELEVERIALERGAIEQRVVGEYGATFFTERVIPLAHTFLPEGLPATERAELMDEVQKIRARIAREGEVDTSSISRFEEEQARLAELTMQREDLSSAARTLGRTIEMLRETSEKRFLTTFRAVRTNFSRLIPRLFGGGKASLELSDPSKPLESGIDISVRPPGKKLKSIELMSGGEKALCAIALIVAMFMERPSPLCVLDEVDAPLDEANLVRFLSLLKDMSNQTQFVVVTHNKQTMTVSDQLIGVTMQQPGASTVVTVSLQEAFRHVA